MLMGHVSPIMMGGKQLGIWVWNLEEVIEEWTLSGMAWDKTAERDWAKMMAHNYQQKQVEEEKRTKGGQEIVEK